MLWSGAEAKERVTEGEGTVVMVACHDVTQLVKLEPNRIEPRVVTRELAPKNPHDMLDSHRDI